MINRIWLYNNVFELPGGDWILLTGFWDDEGFWDDDSIWID